MLIGSYAYNGRGERVRKIASTTDVVFTYDEAGQLLGEYANGITVREYVWLDRLPVGTLTSDALYAIESDHVGSSRRALELRTRSTVWQWAIERNPFGHHAPTPAEAKDGGVVIELLLRYPGQYFDLESGLHYNYFRDYDPGTGRYAQSDPIGLYGGLSTFGYASYNPLLFTDAYGLESGGMYTDAERQMALPTLPRAECGDYCNCLANCIRTNDPAGYLEKMAATAAGGTFPKRIVGLPRGLGGASPLTTAPSATVHYARQCFRIPKYMVRGMRTFGRAFSPLFIGYGLGMATVELGCAAACAENSGFY